MDVVTLEPWNPWPLIVPIVIAIGGVALSIAGGRRRAKGMRESGYVAFIVGSFAAVWMAWSMSGMWDSSAREQALLELGYETPTFSASSQAVGGELPPISFTAIRDGERVRGVVEHVEGSTWRVREVGG